MNCKAENLRFNEGDIIYANVGEFTKGKILKCWDMKEIRTVLKFKMMKKKNVWVPIDNDEYIRDKI